MIKSQKTGEMALLFLLKFLQESYFRGNLVRLIQKKFQTFKICIIFRLFLKKTSFFDKNEVIL